MPANQVAFEELAQNGLEREAVHGRSYGARRTLCAAEVLVSDRRSKARYPVEMNVRYRTLIDGAERVGIGRTLNVSSRGLLIASEQQIVQDGSRLQMSLEWPSLLNGTTPLQLITMCRVIRCYPSAFAVRLESYQFRTSAPHRTNFA
jgi:PilZ domain